MYSERPVLTQSVPWKWLEGSLFSNSIAAVMPEWELFPKKSSGHKDFNISERNGCQAGNLWEFFFLTLKGFFALFINSEGEASNLDIGKIQLKMTAFGTRFSYSFFGLYLLGERQGTMSLYLSIFKLVLNVNSNFINVWMPRIRDIWHICS